MTIGTRRGFDPVPLATLTSHIKFYILENAITLLPFCGPVVGLCGFYIFRIIDRIRTSQAGQKARSVSSKRVSQRMALDQNVDLCDTSLSFAHGTAACDRTMSRDAELDRTGGFSSSFEKKGEDREEFLSFPRTNHIITMNEKPFSKGDEMNSESELTPNLIDILPALSEVFSPTNGTVFNESYNMFRCYVISLTCLLVKALLAYSLVLRSNLSCVQRTYIGLWRPNEHCDY